MQLQDLAKQIAARLKLDVPVVRAVILARGSPRETRKALAESGVDRALQNRIADAARTLIHEELMRLDARHHPAPKQPTPRRRGNLPRRRRIG